MMAELYFALRRPPKRGDAATGAVAIPRLPKLLAQSGIAEIQSAARHLAVFHRSLVQRGPRTKRELDTLVEELAELFATTIDFSGHRHCLPHSEDSHFIQFCRAVLAPHVAHSEATLKALSRRWKRLKDDASRPAKPVKRVSKRRLPPRKKQEHTAD